jgi:SWI/SNF-related matrix-associated actin-dependent regulator 1 of chromatin subfamily A
VIITYWKGVFVVDKADTPAERIALKKAGFELHEPSVCPLTKKCKACRACIGSRYWSNRVESATRLKKYCNQRALDIMADHLKKLQNSRSVTSNLIIPAPPGLAYKPYQKAGVEYLATHKDSYLGDDMGLGKTVQTLGFINYLQTTNPKLNTLIVAPTTLSYNWREEIERWLVPVNGKLPEIIIVPSGSFEVPKRDNLIVVTNYEKLTGDTLLTDSLKRVWDVLVCDEAQALKNWHAQRTQAILGREGLMQRAHRSVFLSGTPIENYPKEIWSIAASICPAKFGDWFEYAGRYCGLHRENHGGRSTLVDTGATHLAELQQRLRSTFMIRRLKSDVLKELPPKRRQLIVLGDSKVDWSSDPDFVRWKTVYEKDYEVKLAHLEAAKTQEEYSNAARHLELFTGVAFKDMSKLRHKTAMAKLPACIEYIDNVLKSGLEKLVIFAHHQDVLKELARHYGDAAVSLDGETPQKDRGPIVKRFQTGDARIFIGGLKAAGVGLNLFAASTAIFIELDWNPAKLSQAEDRLCRIGQEKMVHVIHLVLDDTIDVNICKRVLSKMAVVDKALNQEPEMVIKGLRPEGSPQVEMAL